MATIAHFAAIRGRECNLDSLAHEILAEGMFDPPSTGRYIPSYGSRRWPLIPGRFGSVAGLRRLSTDLSERITRTMARHRRTDASIALVHPHRRNDDSSRSSRSRGSHEPANTFGSDEPSDNGGSREPPERIGHESFAKS